MLSFGSRFLDLLFVKFLVLANALTQLPISFTGFSNSFPQFFQPELFLKQLFSYSLQRVWAFSKSDASPRFFRSVRRSRFRFADMGIALYEQRIEFTVNFQKLCFEPFLKLITKYRSFNTILIRVEILCRISRIISITLNLITFHSFVVVVKMNGYT